MHILLILYIQSLNNDQLIPTVLSAFSISACNDATGRRPHSGVQHLMQTCPYTALQLRNDLRRIHTIVALRRGCAGLTDINNNT